MYTSFATVFANRSFLSSSATICLEVMTFCTYFLMKLFMQLMQIAKWAFSKDFPYCVSEWIKVQRFKLCKLAMKGIITGRIKFQYHHELSDKMWIILPSERSKDIFQKIALAMLAIVNCSCVILLAEMWSAYSCDCFPSCVLRKTSSHAKWTPDCRTTYMTSICIELTRDSSFSQ